MTRESAQKELSKSTSGTRERLLEAAMDVFGRYGYDAADNLISVTDRATNTTRFLVIGEKTCPPTGKDRTSILFAIHDRPGSLVKVLQAFDHCHINMSKIESRPSKRKDWEYIFYVDLAGHCEDPKVSEALEELNRHCSMVKLLGSYPDVGE